MSDTTSPILLVEDNPMDVDLTKRAFARRKLSNPLHIARDGEEALQWIPRWEAGEPRPVIILLDLKLPKVDGLEVLSRIRTNDSTKHIPVIVMTSSQSAEDISRCESMGVQQYLTKPISFGMFSSIAASIGLQWLLLEHRKAGNG